MLTVCYAVPDIVSTQGRISLYFIKIIRIDLLSKGSTIIGIPAIDHHPQ